VGLRAGLDTEACTPKVLVVSGWWGRRNRQLLEVFPAWRTVQDLLCQFMRQAELRDMVYWLCGASKSRC
jgi:hypothetical protein